MNNTHQHEHNNQETKKILDELKVAYKSINSLQKTQAHRKIALELEQKMRKLQKQAESKGNQ